MMELNEDQLLEVTGGRNRALVEGALLAWELSKIVYAGGEAVVNAATNPRDPGPPTTDDPWNPYGTGR